MTRGRLHFTIGLPRSGKSTYCDNWVLNGRLRVVIAGDDFRLALHGHQYVPEAEGQVFASMDIACRALLRRGYDVIVDETCTNPETLRRYLRIDYHAIPHIIPSSVEVCKRRAMETGRSYLIGPIERMNEQMLELLKFWPQSFDDIVRSLEQRQAHDVTV